MEFARDVAEGSKLQGISNYPLWSFKASNALKREKLWDLVSPRTPTSASTESEGSTTSGITITAAAKGKKIQDEAAVDLEELDDRRLKAIGIITTTVQDTLLPHIMYLPEPRDMWLKLKVLYESKSTNRKLALKTQLYNLRLTEKSSMEDHTRNISQIVGQLASINVIIPDDEIVDRTLMSLPSSWSWIRHMVSTRETPITFAELESLLLQEDATRAHYKGRDNTEEALSANFAKSGKQGSRSGRQEGRGRSSNQQYQGSNQQYQGSNQQYWSNNQQYQGQNQPRSRGNLNTLDGRERQTTYTTQGSNNTNKFQARSSGNQNSNSSQGKSTYNRGNGVCHECGSPDHWADQCEIRFLKNRLRELRMLNGNGRRMQQAHVAETYPEEEFTTEEDLTNHEVCAIDTFNPPPPPRNWYLDSGASTHVTGNRDLLTEIRRGPNSRITTANGRTLPVTAQGALTLSGNKISEVLYVPGLCKNLLSVGKFADTGHYTLFGPRHCWVFAHDNLNKVILTGTRPHSNSLYRINTSLTGKIKRPSHMSIPRINAAIVSLPGLTELWHKRLGHINFQSLYYLSQRNMVIGLPLLKKIQPTCEACMLGKQHIHPIPKHVLPYTTRPLELIHSDLCGPLPHTSLKGNRYVLTFIDDFSRRTWVYFLDVKSDTFITFQDFQRQVEREMSLSLACLRTDRGGEYLSSEFNTYCTRQGIQRQFTAAYTPQQNGVAERKNRHLCETMRTLLFDAQLPPILWEEALRTSNYLINRMPHRTLQSSTPLERYSGRKPTISHLRIFGCRSYVHLKASNKLQPKSLPSILVGYDDQTKAYRCFDYNRNKILISRDVAFDETKLGLPPPTSIPDTTFDLIDQFLLLNSKSLSTTLPTTVPSPEMSTPLHSDVLPLPTATNLGLLPDTPGPFPAQDPGPSPNPPNPGPYPDSLVPYPSNPSSPQAETYPVVPIGINPTEVGLPSEIANLPTPSTNISGHIIGTPPLMTTPSPAQPDSTLNSDTYRTPLRRSTRFRKQNVKLDNYILSITPDDFDVCLTETAPDLLGDDISFKQASIHPGWISAMQDEMNSITTNKTWELVPLPPGIKPITSKWVYKTKTALPGQAPRLKARLVARGFQQKAGIDFDEVFAPVVKWSTIRTLTARAAKLGHAIHHLDIKTAFLYGHLTEDVYMQQPQGFVQSGHEHLVCKLKRALYGLRQSPRMWYERIHCFLLSKGYTRSDNDHNMYSKGEGDEKTLLVVYVDDLFITGGDDVEISWIKQELKKEFDISDLGLVNRYLGVNFQRFLHGYFLHQTQYALQILEEQGMTDCKPEHIPLPAGLVLLTDMDAPAVDTTGYCQLVGKLIFLTTTRPDLAFAVGLVSRFMSAPQTPHLAAVLHILRYVKKTTSFGLFYSSQDTSPIRGFTDADWAACSETRRSTGGYCFILSGAAITWQSKKQATVAKSSTESEYLSLSSGASEAAWLQRLLHELQISSSSKPLSLTLSSTEIRTDLQPTKPISIHCDNQSAIKLAKNPVFHARSKHIEIHHHFVRERVLRGEVQLHYVPTDSQPADIFTKPLPRLKFEKHRQTLGIISITP